MEMGRASLNITVTPKRLLKKAEAADYCGLPVKQFETECPVKGVVFANGTVRFDQLDLDVWIETLKTGKADSEDEILKRLGD